MEKIYRDEVFIKFNQDLNKWELIKIECNTVVDTGTSVVCLINNNDCLR